jgi:tetratricopeptide (TPR) repeat protein
MQPLFEQVYHGCAAELYDEVLRYVYFGKLYGGEERVITHRIGAWETNLALVGAFFPEGDLSQLPLVSNKYAQGWIINEAGLALLSIGRPKEAEEPFLTAIKMDIKDTGGNFVSAGYLNLACLQFLTGELERALLSAKKAIEMAEKAKSDRHIAYLKAHLAWILHLMGKSDKASKEFEDADELERKISGVRLHSLRGVEYADFFISLKRIYEAFELTTRNLEICESENAVNDISRCHRGLGAIERIKGNHDEAEDHLQNALELARKIGQPALEIEALLEFGRLHLDRGKPEDAVNACQAVLKLCERTGFKFYEPEDEVVLGKAYLASGDTEQAKTFVQSAYDKAIGMKYRWAEGDAAHLLGEVYLADNKKDVIHNLRERQPRHGG